MPIIHYTCSTKSSGICNNKSIGVQNAGDIVSFVCPPDVTMQYPCCIALCLVIIHSSVIAFRTANYIMYHMSMPVKQ